MHENDIRKFKILYLIFQNNNFNYKKSKIWRLNNRLEIMSYKLPDEKDLEAMIGIVGKDYATNNKAITASYLAKSVMGLEIYYPKADND